MLTSPHSFLSSVFFFLRFLLFASTAWADVKFTSPAAGTTLAAGTAVGVSWQDSGVAPHLADLNSYQLFLCAGGSAESEMIQLATISSQGRFVNGNSAQGVISAGLGSSDTKNAYFLKAISTLSSGGTVINYSPRFSVSGMAGTFPQSVIDALVKVSGTDGPPTVLNAAGGAAAAANDKDPVYGVPYALQTGPTKYAPMQPVPPSVMAQRKVTPLNPTSSVQIAKNWLPRPTVSTTMTQPQTFSAQSRANTAAAVSTLDAMQKYLNRWKD